MASHDVRPLQVALNNYLAASSTGPMLIEDGVFGVATKSAMQAYEASHKLTVSDQPTREVCAKLGADLGPDFPYQPLSPKGPTLNPTIFSGLPATIADYLLNFVTSKINAVAIALVALAVGWINTRFGFVVPEDIQNLVTGWLVAGGGAIIVILRTFFNKPKVIAGTTVTVQK